MTDLTPTNATHSDRYSPRVEFILTAATVAICAFLLLLPQIRGAQAEQKTPANITTHTSTAGVNLTMEGSGSGGALATDD